MIFRNETTAKKEAEFGMHHTMYWLINIREGLKETPASAFRDHNYDAVKSGSHSIVFTDTDTGISYKVTVEPQ